MDKGNTQSTKDDKNPLSGAISDINQEFKETEVQQKAREIGIPYIDVAAVPINDDLLRLIPEEVSKEGKLLPFFQVGKKLRIAIVDPEKKETKEILENLRENGFTVNKNICSEQSLTKAQKNYERIKKAPETIEEVEASLSSEASNIADAVKNLSEIPKKFEEIQSDLALAILHRKAISLKASDLHFESTKKGVRIRGRIDGMLQDFFMLSNSIAKGIIRQIKFNANIRSNEPGIPADGQMVFELKKRNITVRVSILPGAKGESIVMRYLDSKNQLLNIEDLGFLEQNAGSIQKFLQQKDGLILVSGPTGSGKTTTLYSILNTLNTPEKKIITLEDPVEYEVEGIIQSSIQEEKGFSFASGLKSCLRQDPDIVLIGEIRDTNTAEVALKASLTGHLVLSTLHTNDALETIIRLRDLDIENYLISSSVRGIIAQRLVRKVCPHCKKTISYSQDQKQLLMEILNPYIKRGIPLPTLQNKMVTGEGCKKCGNTGYKGRTTISEIIEVTPEIAEKISEGEKSSALKEILEKNNQLFFSFDGAVKILQGVTDFNEITRVLGNKFFTKSKKKGE